MGIPSYFSYIVKNHLTILKRLDAMNHLTIHHLYLDCNSIIYDVVHNMESIDPKEVDGILAAVCKKIDDYIAQLQPQQTVYIAFDGVAPVAKLDQQRERRYKSCYQAAFAKSVSQGKPDPWNTTAITPGTLFMKKLNQTMYSYYGKTYSEKKHGSNGPHIIVSGSDQPGEGEHKLFDHIRHQPEKHGDDTNTVIYGLDADLIMLSINHLPIARNIYLYRETPHFIQSIRADLEPNACYLMDIPELARSITDYMGGTDPKIKVNRIYDYIFLCFFLGNDFMPHFPAVNIRTGGVDKMLEAYRATISTYDEPDTQCTYATLVAEDGRTIHWQNVRKMVAWLAAHEEEYLKNEAKLRDKQQKNHTLSIANVVTDSAEERMKQFENRPMYERGAEKYINPYQVHWQKRYYKALFGPTEEIDKKQICMNYLEGLEWTMKYYTSGCPDWRWCYQYHYPPLLCDLLQFIPSSPYEFVPHQPPKPVHSLVQLSYVLPRQNLYLLPRPVKQALLEKHPEWYSNRCAFLWAYCRYFWESHVCFPDVDIEELEQLVKDTMSKGVKK